MKISSAVFNKCLALILLALFCIGRETAAGPVSESDRNFARAERLRRDKKYTEAIPIYGKVIPSGANVTVSLVARARCYKALGDNKNALRDLNLAAEHDPGKPESYHLAAQIYLEQKKYKEAINEADESLDIRWNYEDCLKIKAMALFGDRQFDRALKLLNNAILLNPKDLSLVFQRGLVYEQMGDFSPAAADFQTVIAANPGDTGARVKLAKVKFRMGSYVQAEKQATGALARDPKLAEAFSVRSAALSALGKYDRATTDAVQVVKLQPNDPHAYAALGELEYQKKNYDAAIINWKRCNELNPTFVHGKAHHFLSKAYKEKGLLKESAAEQFEAQHLGYPDVD